MGLGTLGNSDVCFKRKFRWLFLIPSVSGAEIGMLPPERGARPSVTIKENEAQHLNEIIYFPSKPDWKPINLTLYDLKTNNNPVINWLSNQYNPQTGSWNIGYGEVQNPANEFKKDAQIQMLDGCGDIIEEWELENVWPNNIEWGELDMSDSNYVTVDLTLRYDRAYKRDSNFLGFLNSR